MERSGAPLNYPLNSEGGLALFRYGEPILGLPPDGTFAILYDADGGNADSVPGILKHGGAEAVMADYRSRWAAMQRAAMSSEGAFLMATIQQSAGWPTGTPSAREMLRNAAADLRIVSVRVSDMTPEIVEEVNACLACSGRVGRFKERLEALLETRDEPEPVTSPGPGL